MPGSTVKLEWKNVPGYVKPITVRCPTLYEVLASPDLNLLYDLFPHTKQTIRTDIVLSSTRSAATHASPKLSIPRIPAAPHPIGVCRAEHRLGWRRIRLSAAALLSHRRRTAVGVGHIEQQSFHELIASGSRAHGRLPQQQSLPVARKALEANKMNLVVPNPPAAQKVGLRHQKALKCVPARDFGAIGVALVCGMRATAGCFID